MSWSLYYWTLGFAIGGTVVYFLFAILYQLLTRWWMILVGWRIMSLMVAIFLALLVTVSNALGLLRSLSLNAKLWVQLVIFALIFAIGCWHVIDLLVAQLKRRKDATPGRSEAEDQDAGRPRDSEPDR